MRKLLLLLLAFMASIFFLLLLFNTLSWRSMQVYPPAPQKAAFSIKKAAKRLSLAIKRPSPKQQQLDSLSWGAFLRRYYPTLVNHPNTELIVLGENLTILHWKGRDLRLLPFLAVSYIQFKEPELDNLPAWTHGPYSGEQQDAFVWGLGSQRGMANAIAYLEVFQQKLAENSWPERSFYLLMAPKDRASAQRAARYFKRKGLRFELALGPESDIYTENELGIAAPIAALAIGEVQTLETKIWQADESQLKAGLHYLEGQTYDWSQEQAAYQAIYPYLGPELPFVKRFLWANRFYLGDWSSSSLGQGPILSAWKNEVAIKEEEAGYLRLQQPLPPDYQASDFSELGQYADSVEYRSWGDSSLSLTQGFSYELLQTHVRQIFPKTLVLPTVLPKTSYYRASLQPFCEQYYHFSPWRFDAAERLRLSKQEDERLGLDNFMRGLQFYEQLLERLLF